MNRRTSVPVVGITDVLPRKSAGHHVDRPTILVVDDECAIADTLSEILARSGYNTLTAYDAASALEAALLHPPEVLVTDVILPGMSGIELAISIRRIFPDCKVILFSGNAATSSLLASATRGGHNFALLNKPVHPPEMLSRIAECIRPQAGARAS